MQKYLIFGGTGSLGKKLIDRLISTDQVVVYSRDESKHFTIRNEFSSHQFRENLSFVVGDVRDARRVKETIQRHRPDVIIVAAALKQVDTCELSPVESISTNLLGTLNVMQAVEEAVRSNYDSTSHSRLKVLFVSTDKACSPVNVYGMCKSISERITTSLSSPLSNLNRQVDFVCTRYGNVLESRGSIIPLFKYQVMTSDVITVTDPEMTRFVMTLDESVDLILDALKMNDRNGRTLIPILPAMRIGDLANIFARRYSKQIKIIGVRPGEKKHEELINASESSRTKRINDHYVIEPAYSPPFNEETFAYTSADKVFTEDELEKHLERLGIFEMSLDKFVGRSIEEIAK